jgi:competence protein ComEC
MIYLNTVSFAIGIFLKDYFNISWSSFLFVCILFVVSTLVLNKKENFKFIFCILFLILGFFRMYFSDSSPDQMLLQSVGRQFSFEAVVVEEPDIRDSGARYTIKPVESKSLVLLVADRFPELKYGDKIKVKGKTELPKNFITETGKEFDYISFLSKDKIHFIIYRGEIEKLEEGFGNKIVESLYTLKNNFIENMGRVVREPDSSLLAGLIFGVKQSLGQELLDDFKKVGLVHIIVLSGYNLTIVALAILYVTSYTGKRNLGFVLSAIGIVLFAIMVGLGATVVRASIMALIAILARYLGRPTDALRALFVAGFVMLLWNPLTLLRDPSFQLSFSATLGLILYSPFIYNFVSQKIPIITEKLGLREILSSTFAVQLFVLPLLTKMSGVVSVISFVVNLLVLPLVPYAMLFGFLAGLFGFIPFIGMPLAWASGIIAFVFTKIIIFVTEVGASIPFAVLQTGALSIFGIIIWYLVYTFLYFKLSKRNPPNLSAWRE